MLCTNDVKSIPTSRTFFPVYPSFKCFSQYGDGTGMSYQCEFHERDTFVVKVNKGWISQERAHNTGTQLKKQMLTA